ncbi:tripartite motif containing 13-like [Palaemon carinicauda]|uniref:tripartite motif containing 13-like n=1 Tax=Palaemon carinicauda TaxID=392227 RepID=UPI0035B659EC
MDSNALECGICNELYDEGDFCPRILPCSHSHCSSCIQQLISTRQKFCPICRRGFTAVSAGDLMINRSLVDVIRQFSASGRPRNHRFGVPGRPFKGAEERSSQAERLEFQKDIIKIRLAQCKEKRTVIQKSIQSYLMFMGEASNFSKETGSLFNEILQDSKREAEIMTKGLADQVKLMQAMTTLSLKGEDKIEGLIEKYNTAKTSSSLTSKQLEDDDKSLKEYIQHIEDQCVIADKKIRLMKLKYFRLESKLSVIRGIMAEEGREGEYITSENLRKMSSSLREIIEAGKLLAFQDHQGRRRYASIKLESRKRISLFQLKELRHVPGDPFLIKHEEAMKLLDLSNCRTFLEIGAGETVKVRLVIKLTSEGHYPSNFLHLCTGSKGPSYGNSKILEVKNTGMKGERVRMGNYETDTKGGGKAVIKGVNWGQEMEKEIYKRKSCQAGLVKGLNGPDEESVSQFFIITKADPASAPYPCFGMVEGELDAFRNIILQQPDLTRLRIVNSGVILSI